MIRIIARRSLPPLLGVALLSAGLAGPANAGEHSDDFFARPVADDAVTIDLAAQVEAAAGDAIMAIPVVDLGRIGPVGDEGTVFTVTLPAGTYLDGEGQTRSYTRAAAWKCTAQAHNPHISAGAGGVIGKATVSCTGSSGSLPIQASLILGKNNKNSTSGVWFEKQATYTQNVTSNLGNTTWYVPQLGTKGAAAGGYFRTSVGAVSMPPVVATNIASHASSIVQIKG
jgi:hypothetical protein